MGGHNRGQHKHKGGLAQLGGLNGNGQEGEVQPASVAGAIVRAEGDQQQKQHAVKAHKPVAVLGEKIRIHGGYGKKQENTQKGGTDLHQHISEGALGIGGTGDHQAAKGGGHKAQQKKHKICLTDGIFDISNQTVHTDSLRFRKLQSG